MSPSRFIKSYDSLKVKVFFWNEIENNVYIVLQIQLKCTNGIAFIYFDVLYLKCLLFH